MQRISQYNDQNLEKNQTIDTQIRVSKKTFGLSVQNMGLEKVTKKLLDLTYLKILDLSFNNIVVLPPQIQEFACLEQLYMNQNRPLYQIPKELSECKKLQKIDFSYTSVRKLPRELANLPKLFALDLSGCPIYGNMDQAYQKGIVYLQQYFRRKWDRAVYKKLICKNLKDWVYMDNTMSEIQDKIQQVFDNLKDVDSKTLKRLNINMNNIFPLKLEEVQPENIRKKLFQSLVNTKGSQNTKKLLEQQRILEEQRLAEQQRQQEEEEERLRQEEEERERLRLEEEERLRQEEEERLRLEEEEKSKNAKKGAKKAGKK